MYAYITRAEQLLVFKQVDFPKAGIQIPGGPHKALPFTDIAALVLQISFILRSDWRKKLENTWLYSCHFTVFSL